MLWIGPQEPETRSVRELARLVGLALKLAWRAGKRELVPALSLQGVSAIGFVVLLLLGRDVVADALADRSAVSSAAASAVVSAGIAFAGSVAREQQQLLSELTETPLLPLAQELLVNAVKHARPTAIEVSVTEAAEGIVLQVSDDGVGIDAAESDRAARAGHVGLAVVRRRVQDAGGSFEIATRANGGTRSRAVLPPPVHRT